MREVVCAARSAAYLVGFAMAMEWIPRGWRTAVGTGFHALCFASGELLLSGLGASQASCETWALLRGAGPPRGHRRHAPARDRSLEPRRPVHVLA